MITGLLEAWRWEGNPLQKFIKHMSWKIDFTERDMDDLSKYMLLLTPLEKLFSRLNADQSSTIHLVYPYLMVSIKSDFK